MNRYNNITDQELIDRLIVQDDLLFQTVQNFVIKHHGSLDDAKDIFQDVILVLYQKVRRGKLVLTCSLKTYLYSIARNLWLKELERRNRMVKVYREKEEDMNELSDIEDIYIHNKRLILYYRFFSQLGQICKRIITLFNEGNSIREITVMIGYKNEQLTKNRHYRCKKQLIHRIRSSDEYKKLRYGKDGMD